jgi:hypothetical protein
MWSARNAILCLPFYPYHSILICGWHAMYRQTVPGGNILFHVPGLTCVCECRAATLHFLFPYELISLKKWVLLFTRMLWNIAYVSCGPLFLDIFLTLLFDNFFNTWFESFFANCPGLHYSIPHTWKCNVLCSVN